MAPKATIFKVNLAVADITRGYYEDHILTVARHPSETDIRMLMRVVAFALNAHEYLKFGKGISSAEEPDLWQIDLTGKVDHWIDLGQPAEKRIRQACGKANKVSIYTYQKGAALPWFQEVAPSLTRFRHLRVVHLVARDEAVLESLVDRTMDLSCTFEDEQAMLTDGKQSAVIEHHVAKNFGE